MSGRRLPAARLNFSPDCSKTSSAESDNEVEWACEPTETFETLVQVELSGMPKAVEASEVEALEHSFVNTFKILSASCCDPLFRTPLEVSIDTMTRRSLQSSPNTFKYEYSVKGLCRGCGGNSRLFGQSVRRMLSGLGGTLREDNLCFCSHNSVADWPPTEDEFGMAYNETVQNLNLPHIRHVMSVKEPAFEPANTKDNGVNVTVSVVTTSVTTAASNKPTTYAPTETSDGAPDAPPTDTPTCPPAYD